MSNTGKVFSKSLPPERETKKMTCASLAHWADVRLAGRTAVLPYAQWRLTAHSEEAHTLKMPESTRLHQAPSLGR
jgi:hypothetical protein